MEKNTIIIQRTVRKQYLNYKFSLTTAATIDSLPGFIEYIERVKS